MVRHNEHRRNQLLYREVNKRIREVGDSSASDERAGFLCECGEPDCTETFELTRSQFDGLLSDPNRVLLATQHRAYRNGERVVAEYDTFVVVAAS